ncbi:hypothetical protein HY385_01830 [Candidatus Daviesbacteria bacterium]|nr:hypothetical protein [Candidatus Daviesbacteria bacterium]
MKQERGINPEQGKSWSLIRPFVNKIKDIGSIVLCSLVAGAVALPAVWAAVGFLIHNPIDQATALYGAAGGVAAGLALGIGLTVGKFKRPSYR